MPILGVIDSSKLKITGSFESIATATGTGSAGASITFSSIPQTYRNLQVRARVKDTLGGTGTAIYSIRFNGDSSGLYSWQRAAVAQNSAFNPNSSGATTQINQFGAAFYSGNTGVGVAIIDIFEYTSTSKAKVTRALNGTDNNGNTGFVCIEAGIYASTSAITSITFVPENGFTTATQFALYGIKDA